MAIFGFSGVELGLLLFAFYLIWKAKWSLLMFAIGSLIISSILGVSLFSLFASYLQ